MLLLPVNLAVQRDRPHQNAVEQVESMKRELEQASRDSRQLTDKLRRLEEENKQLGAVVYRLGGRDARRLKAQVPPPVKAYMYAYMLDPHWRNRIVMTSSEMRTKRTTASSFRTNSERPPRLGKCPPIGIRHCLPVPPQ